MTTPVETPRPLYPVGLVVSGRRCLVVGGGRLAGRKVRSLLRCGAAVTVVAPEPDDALRELDDAPRELDDALRELDDDGAPGAVDMRGLDVQRRAYEPGEAAGYRLVVAASGDPDLDAAVYEDAEAAGVWVNSADDSAHCSVMLPAVWRTGAVTVSVATDGTSPALAGWLRTRVARTLGDSVGQLAALLGDARRRVRDEGRPTGSVDWSSVLEGPVPALVAGGRLAEARAAIDAAVSSSLGGPSAPEPAGRGRVEHL